MASGQKVFLAKKNIDTYDSIQCVIEWELPNKEFFNQVIVTNWIDSETSSAMSNQRIKVIGTDGRYEADQMNRGITFNTDQVGIEHINPDFCIPIKDSDGVTKWQGYGIDSVVTFLNDIIDIETGQSSINKLSLTRPTFKESLISSAVIESANQSLESNGDWKIIKLTQEDAQ